MKSKFSKIFLLITALTLILGVCFAITASAEGETEAKPEIISKNIYYTDVLSIMYAVDADTVAEGAVTLKVYTENPETAENPKATTYVAEAPQTEKINGEEKSVYVFITDGVCVKDMADVFYAQATDSEGNKSAVYTYSVVEYMLERLYGGKTVTDVQKRTYEAALEFGAASQALLCPEDEIKVDDYKYVRVEGGKVNGVEKGVFVEGSTLTLESDGASVAWWNVESATEKHKLVGSQITLSENVAITATIGAGSVGYYGTFGGKSYDGLTKNVWNSFVNAPDLIDRLGTINTDLALDNTTTNNLTVQAISDTNTVLTLVRANNSNDAGISFKTAGGSGNCLAFETDLYISNNPSLYFTIGYAYTAAASTNAELLEYGQYDVTYADGGFDVFGVTVAPETWVNIAAELYTSEGLIKYYVNGVNTLTVDVDSAPEITHFSFYIPGENTRNSSILFDNTYFASVNRYAESDEYYTFGDGTLPTSVTKYLADGTSTLTVSDAPWLNVSEKALNLTAVAGKSKYVYFAEEKNADATKAVFEANYLTRPENESHQIGYFYFMNDNTNLWQIMVFFDANGYLNIQDYIKNGTGNQSVKVAMDYNQWINLKFEAYANESGEFIVDVYLNGTKQFTSCNTMWTSSSLADINRVGYMAPNNFAGNIYFDDVNFEITAQ